MRTSINALLMTKVESISGYAKRVPLSQVLRILIDWLKTITENQCNHSLIPPPVQNYLKLLQDNPQRKPSSAQMDQSSSSKLSANYLRLHTCWSRIPSHYLHLRTSVLFLKPLRKTSYNWAFIRLGYLGNQGSILSVFTGIWCLFNWPWSLGFLPFILFAYLKYLAIGSWTTVIWT